MLITVSDFTILHRDYSELPCRAITSIDIATSTTPRMAGFLDLSREIRDMIYKLCLVTEKVIVPFKEHYPLDRVKDIGFRDNMPTVALLGVSKLIGAEAAEILYGKNTWRITSEAPDYYHAGEAGYLNDVQLWKRRAGLFRHIYLVFNHRDIDPDKYSHQIEWEHEDLENSQETSRTQQWILQDTLHGRADDLMKDTWHDKLEFLPKMPNLVTVQIDVAKLYCSSGCCRKEVLKALLECIKEM